MAARWTTLTPALVGGGCFILHTGLHGMASAQAGAVAPSCCHVMLRLGAAGHGGILCPTVQACLLLHGWWHVSTIMVALGLQHASLSQTIGRPGLIRPAQRKATSMKSNARADVDYTGCIAAGTSRAPYETA